MLIRQIPKMLMRQTPNADEYALRRQKRLDWLNPKTLCGRRQQHPQPSDLIQSVFKVVLQKSIPTQIRQRVLYISNSKGYVDGFVEELPSAKRLYKHFE